MFSRVGNRRVPPRPLVAHFAISPAGAIGGLFLDRWPYRGQKCVMKSKGRTAWLITWEGPESVHTGRCKVVAVLPPQFGETGITAMLPFLYCAGYNHTLCEKMGFSTPSRKDDRLLRIAYRDIHPEFWYGVYPKEYLCARKVKNLRCEESKIDCFENTLHWTELAKYIPNPQIDFGGPLPDN